MRCLPLIVRGRCQKSTLVYLHFFLNSKQALYINKVFQSNRWSTALSLLAQSIHQVSKLGNDKNSNEAFKICVVFSIFYLKAFTSHFIQWFKLCTINYKNTQKNFQSLEKKINLNAPNDKS